MKPRRSIVVKDLGFAVEEAPDESSISLELLAQADSRTLIVHGDRILIGSIPNVVMYEVTGWDAAAMGLVVRRVGREPDVTDIEEGSEFDGPVCI